MDGKISVAGIRPIGRGAGGTGLLALEAAALAGAFFAAAALLAAGLAAAAGFFAADAFAVAGFFAAAGFASAAGFSLAVEVDLDVAAFDVLVDFALLAGFLALVEADVGAGFDAGVLTLITYLFGGRFGACMAAARQQSKRRGLGGEKIRLTPVDEGMLRHGGRVNLPDLVCVILDRAIRREPARQRDIDPSLLRP